MSDTQQPATGANGPLDFTNCPYWGMGGRYVVDPATGLRIPVALDGGGAAPDPTAAANPANPAADDAGATDPAMQPVKPLKEKKNA